MKTSPAFMCYASDTIADKRYRMMTLAERGLYFSMMNECWVNHSVPAELSELAKWLGNPIEDIHLALTDRVRSFFTEAAGEFRSPELEKYRHELLERRQKLSKGGKKGAKAKWDKPSGRDSHPNDQANGLSMASRVEMSGNEKKRTESLGKPVNDDPWVRDYDKASNGG